MRDQQRARRRASSGTGGISTGCAALRTPGTAPRAARCAARAARRAAGCGVGSPPASCRKRPALGDRCTMSCSRVDQQRRRRELLQQPAGAARPRTPAAALVAARGQPRSRARPRASNAAPGSHRRCAAAAAPGTSAAGRAGAVGQRQPGAGGRARAHRCGASCRRAENSALPSSTDSEAPRNSSPSGASAKWKVSKHALLRLAVEVDQQVAAGDQVEARERRVLAARRARRTAPSRAARAARGSRGAPCTKKRRSRSSLHVGLDRGRVDGRRAPCCTASSSRSVAKTWISGGASSVRACSASSMASEYASSPVAQAGTQTRTASPGPLPSNSAGQVRLQRGEAVRVAEEVGDADQQVLQQRAAPRRAACAGRRGTPAGRRRR